jgi:hypothetical protein
MSDIALGHHGAYVMVPLRLIEGRWKATNAGRDAILTGVRRCMDLSCDGHPPLPTVVELVELLGVGDGAINDVGQVPVHPSSPVDGAASERP